MQFDVAQAAKLGASGVVIGALTPDGAVDEAVTRRLASVAQAAVRILLWHTDQSFAPKAGGAG